MEDKLLRDAVLDAIYTVLIALAVFKLIEFWVFYDQI